MKRLKLTFLFVIFQVLGSCHSDRDKQTSQLTIAGSRPGPIPKEIYFNTLKIFKNNRFHCTGFAVTKNLVVTAAHCILNDPDPTQYTLQTGDANAPALPVRSMNYFRHHMDNPSPSELERYWPSGDIAWIKPLHPLPDDVEIISPMNPKLNPTLRGFKATIAGYGSTGFHSRDGGLLRIGTTNIQESFTAGPFKGLILAVSPSLSAPCRGDSGGPMYVTIDGQIFLAGIASGVDSLLTPEAVNLPDPCKGGEAVYNDLRHWLPWIKADSGDPDLPDYDAPPPGPDAIDHHPESMTQWCQYSKISSSEGLLLRIIMSKLGTSRCSRLNTALIKKQGKINLSHEGLKAVTPLAQLDQLISLNLSGNQIEEISRNSFPESLEHLNLSKNPLRKLESGGAPSALKSIQINHSETVVSMNPDWPDFFTDATQIETIEFTNFGLTQIQGNLPKSVRRLNLSGNQISDLDFLRNLDSLKELYLNRNQIDEVCTLSQLSGLQLLTVSQNNISDLDCLSDLRQLEMLSAWSNPLIHRNCPVPEVIPGDICGF